MTHQISPRRAQRTDSTRVLVTSALPYIAVSKHLGNLAGSLLPADVHARHRRQIGHDVLFVCATDEHGTPAEIAAAAAGQDPQAFCDAQHPVQKDIYRRLGISFDHFGRSSSPQNHALTQHFFRKLEENGFIEERTVDQVWSPADGRFLPDRYIVGTCPACRAPGARGDQCDACGRQLDPVDLIDARSAISGSADLEVRPSRHLYLRQSALVGDLETWIGSRVGWPSLVTSIARKWLDEGIRDRCITRDLSWGVPVPKEGFEGKSFYVWFDAPIEYIAATQEWSDLDPEARDWRSWWWQADDVDHIQFLAKDNVPFHAVSFPCTLLGSREPWKTVDVIKGVEWLTYQGGKFSTSQRRGVFLDQALELLPADYWRWWLAANCPEGGDTDFAFGRFAEHVNADLADNFGNLVNRTLKFAQARYQGVVPEGGEPGPAEVQLVRDLDARLAVLRECQDALSFRKSADAVRSIWSLANAYVADQAPWTAFAKDPPRAAVVLRTAVNLIGVAASVAWPFIPSTSERVLQALGCSVGGPPPILAAEQALQAIRAGRQIAVPDVLFAKLGEDWVAENVARFAGGSAGPPGSAVNPRETIPS